MLYPEEELVHDEDIWDPIMSWYGKVTHDISKLPDFIAYYDNEIQEAKKDVGIYGIVEKAFQANVGITEHPLINYKRLKRCLTILIFN